MKKWNQLGVAVLVAALLSYSAPALARITGTPPTNSDIWCVGPDGAEACVQADGSVVPTTTNDADLGTSSLKWNEVHVTAGGLTDSAIQTDDLSTDAITAAKILTGAVETSKILTAAVVTEKLATDSVIAAKILSAAVITAKLATDSVTDAKILSGAVITAKLASDAVTSAKIADSAVGTGKITLGTNGEMPDSAVLCKRSDEKIGVCTDVVSAIGKCTCN